VKQALKFNSLMADDSWPDLLGALFQLSQAPEPDKRETAFRVFATTPGIIEKQHETVVLEAFNKGFTDDAVVVSDAPPGLVELLQY
jgi:importin-5